MMVLSLLIILVKILMVISGRLDSVSNWLTGWIKKFNI
jgi:hypothetical protein